MVIVGSILNEDALVVSPPIYYLGMIFIYCMLNSSAGVLSVTLQGKLRFFLDTVIYVGGWGEAIGMAQIKS